ncbi:MAG: hypothetical protein KA436_02715 [Oligoflexales bacterium]|nr:hypothetical protein [Oligoflexales bacterium]
MSLVSPLYAATHFSLQGSASYNNLGLNNEDSKAITASVSQDLGKYFGIGVTHRQGETTLKGYKYLDILDLYFSYEQRIRTIANSLDLTLVLYYGEVFVPYLQVGMVKKNYVVTTYGISGDEQAEPKAYSLPPVPSAGMGLGIKINANFSLKLSYTVSPGIKQTNPASPPESVLDSYTAVGISYNI